MTLPVTRQATRRRSRTSRTKPRLFWASPLPPIRSGVADYAAEVLPHLVEHADVVVVEPPDWSPGSSAESWLGGVAGRVKWDAPTPKGTACVVHLGNNPYHLWVARRLRLHGGVVVLHDAVLHHLLVEEAADDGAWERFASELEAAHGAAGQAIAVARRWGFHGLLDPFLLPARACYMSHADGVIVHNRRAGEAVARCCPRIPLRQVPLAVAALDAGSRAAWRKRLQKNRDELLAVHLGFLTRAKGLDTVLRGVAIAKRLGVAVRLVVVGEGEEEKTLTAHARAAGIGELVTLWGYADRDELGGILAAADLGVAPRYPTAGETSAAVLRFLAVGTPVAVSGYGQFLELPVDAAPRVRPGRAGAVDLAKLLCRLAKDPELQTSSRVAARKAWMEGRNDPKLAAAELFEAVRDLTEPAAQRTRACEDDGASG